MGRPLVFPFYLILCALLSPSPAFAGPISVPSIPINFTASYLQFIDNSGAFLASENGSFQARITNSKPESRSFYFVVVHVASHTIVWSANRNRHISQSSQLCLTAQGLTLYNDSTHPIWSTPPNPTPVSSMHLLESGNLLLLDFPTDLLVSDQTLPAGKSLVVSSDDDGELSQGSYRLVVADDDAVLQWNGMVYWKLSMDENAFRGHDSPRRFPHLQRYRGLLSVVSFDPIDTSSNQVMEGRPPVIAIAVVVLVCLRRRLSKKVARSKQDDEEMDLVSIPGLPVRIDYAELADATENFKNQIGSGGFGTVYKGTLLDGSEVGVKKITCLGSQGRREFLTEIAVIGKIHHVNLVRLRGSALCAHGPQKLLVYESGARLRWGAARGLAYMHSGCEHKIIHCDVKPENILLHHKSQVKISDFGLSKLLTPEQSSLFTALRGTRGYLAPGWLTSSAITDKSDVYSYGMVLLEIIRGNKNLTTRSNSSAAALSPCPSTWDSAGQQRVYFPPRRAGDARRGEVPGAGGPKVGRPSQKPRGREDGPYSTMLRKRGPQLEAHHD
ncbi:hypothetical protein SASPL_147183 [Salvia splendens]|uniref:Protein kinase domain-containing protein n=1 Tax=Salvia splendens TaxID=180675 RepID=A0A8X8Z6H5_SALSN|nr:hypothetical protein SASPL_147183 [Salvia splendens]